MKNNDHNEIINIETALFEIDSRTLINPKNYQNPSFKYVLDTIETMMKLENVSSENFGLIGSKEQYAAFWGSLIENYLNKDLEIKLSEKRFPDKIQFSGDCSDGQLFI
jgi:hypothetical protein